MELFQDRQNSSLSVNSTTSECTEKSLKLQFNDISEVASICTQLERNGVMDDINDKTYFRGNTMQPFPFYITNMIDETLENISHNTKCDMGNNKTLTEMGFKLADKPGWNRIKQPTKLNLYKLLRHMINNYIKPNVEIMVGKISFHCHMLVLQCYSDFFMECNNEVLIQLPEEKISPGAFMMVYDWMLSDEPLIQCEGILELYNAASFLRVNKLVEQCWVCIDNVDYFREDAAFLLYLEARKFKLDKLQQMMLMRVCKFFLTLVASKEFLLMSCDEVCKLFSSNLIGVNTEIEVLMSAIRWLNYNWEKRKADMLQVIKCVRFSLMPPWYLVSLTKPLQCPEVGQVTQHPEIYNLITESINYTTTQLYYGSNRDEFLFYVEKYNLTIPSQRQWLCDRLCKYHHSLDCAKMDFITYKSFLEYLNMIQSRGIDHWKQMELASNSQEFRCCTPSKVQNETDLTVVTKTVVRQKFKSSLECEEKKNNENSKNFDTKNNITNDNTNDKNKICYQYDKIANANNPSRTGRNINNNNKWRSKDIRHARSPSYEDKLTQTLSTTDEDVADSDSLGGKLDEMQYYINEMLNILQLTNFEFYDYSDETFSDRYKSDSQGSLTKLFNQQGRLSHLKQTIDDVKSSSSCNLRINESFCTTTSSAQTSSSSDIKELNKNTLKKSGCEVNNNKKNNLLCLEKIFDFEPNISQEIKLTHSELNQLSPQVNHNAMHCAKNSTHYLLRLSEINEMEVKLHKQLFERPPNAIYDQYPHQRVMKCREPTDILQTQSINEVEEENYRNIDDKEEFFAKIQEQLWQRNLQQQKEQKEQHLNYNSIDTQLNICIDEDNCRTRDSPEIQTYRNNDSSVTDNQCNSNNKAVITTINDVPKAVIESSDASDDQLVTVEQCFEPIEYKDVDNDTNQLQHNQSLGILPTCCNNITYQLLVFGGMNPDLHTCTHQTQRIPKSTFINTQPIPSRAALIPSTISNINVKESYSLPVVHNNTTTNLGNNTGGVFLYDPSALQWYNISNIPCGSRHHHSTVICNSLVYVIGGTRITHGQSNKSVFEKSIWCFDPKTLKWKMETNLPESRRDFAAVAVNHPVNEFCKYSLNNTNYPGSSTAIKSFDRGFFIIGGEGTNGIPLRTVWFYSIRRKQWIKKAPLNIGRSGLMAVLRGNEIWVAGGTITGQNPQDTLAAGSTSKINAGHARHNGPPILTDIVEIYHLKCYHANIALNNDDSVRKQTAPDYISNCFLGRWRISNVNLRIPRVLSKFCQMNNGDLYIVGGIGIEKNSAFKSLSSIDYYNPEQSIWEHKANLLYSRHSHDVGTLNDHYMVILGGVTLHDKSNYCKVETFCTKTNKLVKILPDLPHPVCGSSMITLK